MAKRWSYDRAAKRAYQRQWMRDRRTEGIAALGGKCVRCSSPDDLQVDHIDPATKVTHRIWGMGKEKRDSELLKCQLLCRVCHLEKTRADRAASTGPRVHGQYRTYKAGCRCDDCRYANKRYARQLRLRRGGAV